MSLHLTVRWTIRACAAPRLRRHCHACAAARAFVPTGKARLNANGKRLDAWLVYRCADCGSAWNRPVFERKAVADLPRDLLAALQANDPEVIERLSADPSGLAPFARRVDGHEAVEVRKSVLHCAPAAAARLSLTLLPEGPVQARPDRMVSTELGLSRSRLGAMLQDGRLLVVSGRSATLRRQLRHPIRLEFRLAGESDAGAIIDAARRDRSSRP